MGSILFAGFYVKIQNEALIAGMAAFPVAQPPTLVAPSFDPKSTRRPPYMLEEPYMTGVRKGVNAREDGSFLYERFDLPGQGQQHVEVTMEKNYPPGNDTLILKIRKEHEKSVDHLAPAKECTLNFKFSPLLFKSDEVTWEMNNGVLIVKTPKVEKDDEDRYGVWDATYRLSCLDESSFLTGRGEWYAKAKRGKGLSLRIDMPGLDEGHVKVFLEDDRKTLVIEGQGDEESRFEGYGKRYTKCGLDITNFSKTKRSFSIENGVFMLTIPPK